MHTHAPASTIGVDIWYHSLALVSSGHEDAVQVTSPVAPPPLFWALVASVGLFGNPALGRIGRVPV